MGRPPNRGTTREIPASLSQPSRGRHSTRIRLRENRNDVNLCALGRIKPECRSQSKRASLTPSDRGCRQLSMLRLTVPLPNQSLSVADLKSLISRRKLVQEIRPSVRRRFLQFADYACRVVARWEARASRILLMFLVRVLQMQSPRRRCPNCWPDAGPNRRSNWKRGSSNSADPITKRTSSPTTIAALMVATNGTEGWKCSGSESSEICLATAS